MKELLNIFAAYREAQNGVALATIVKTAGSSYRRPGARMLISPDGRTIGCISGGCLDQDVVEHGLNVIKNQKAILITYDTSSDQDLVLGVGLGCKGVIDILIEFLPTQAVSTAKTSAFLDFVENVIKHRRIGAVATVIRTSGNVGFTLGDRVMVDDSGHNAAVMHETSMRVVLEKFAVSALTSRRPEVVDYESPTGSAQIFVETFLPQNNLVILGAGHDAMPLAKLAHELGFRVTVMDGRPGYVTRERFPTAEQLVIARAEDDCAKEIFDARTAVVIMSHNYLIDQAWLARLLPVELAYLGLMGPRKRAEKMLAELQAEGFETGNLSSLHNPIGLDIGAETPEEIALAILGEVQATIAGHEGGKLRHKKGVIHSPATQPKLEALPSAPLENSCATLV